MCSAWGCSQWSGLRSLLKLRSLLVFCSPTKALTSPITSRIVMVSVLARQRLSGESRRQQAQSKGRWPLDEVRSPDAWTHLVVLSCVCVCVCVCDDGGQCKQCVCVGQRKRGNVSVKRRGSAGAHDFAIGEEVFINAMLGNILCPS